MSIVVVNQKKRHRVFLPYCIALLLSVLLSSCSILAPFDESALNESYAIKRDVASLYQLMQDIPQDQRQYAQFRRDYANIIASLNGLLERQQRRDKNTESTKITQTILDFVVKYRDAHKEIDTYKNGKLKLHKKRLTSVLQSLIDAEEAKRR